MRHVDSRFRVVRNLVANPSFEAGLAGVSAGLASISRSSLWAVQGDYCLAITPTGGGLDSFAAFGSPGSIALGMLPGNTYTVSATVHIEGPQVSALPSRARNLYFNVGSAAYVGVQPPNEAGSYRVSVTATIPIASTQAFIRLYNGSDDPASIVYWDAVMLTEGSTPYAYADGDSPNWQWDGTPDASTSRGYVWLGA